MAEFVIAAGKFTVQVNDAHTAETYEIEAASPEEAKAKAAELWRMRDIDASHLKPTEPEPVAEEPAEEAPHRHHRRRRS